MRPLAIEDYDAIDLLSYLFGIDTVYAYNDPRGVSRAFACPIGEGAGGDTIVQISSGKAKGKIYLVDHKVIPPADDMKDDGVDLETMSADQALEYLCDQRGCFNKSAGSFPDFSGQARRLRQ